MQVFKAVLRFSLHLNEFSLHIENRRDAGYLIEAAGLKGFRYGGAQISEKHANFFINDEDATAEDVRVLIAEAWNTVRENFGVELDLEVELVGDWKFDEDDG